MEEHSASLPLVRLSLQRELWPMQRKAKSYFKVCFLREELEARLLHPSTVAQIPRLDFWVLCLKHQQHHMYWGGVLIKSACLLNFSFFFYLICCISLCGREFDLRLMAFHCVFFFLSFYKSSVHMLCYKYLHLGARAYWAGADCGLSCVWLPLSFMSVLFFSSVTDLTGCQVCVYLLSPLHLFHPHKKQIGRIYQYSENYLFVKACVRSSTNFLPLRLLELSS